MVVDFAGGERVNGFNLSRVFRVGVGERDVLRGSGGSTYTNEERDFTVSSYRSLEKLHSLS